MDTVDRLIRPFILQLANLANKTGTVWRKWAKTDTLAPKSSKFTVSHTTRELVTDIYSRYLLELLKVVVKFESA